MLFALSPIQLQGKHGRGVGEMVGTSLGTELGPLVGTVLGTVLGAELGAELGFLVGTELGTVLGAPLGAAEGAALGAELGTVLGAADGTVLGVLVGCTAHSSSAPRVHRQSQNPPMFRQVWPLRHPKAWGAVVIGHTSPSVAFSPTQLQVLQAKVG